MANMTVNQIITSVDLKEPNNYTAAEKIHWLSNLDGKIFEEVIKTHEGYDPDTDAFTPYFDGTEELLIQVPYGEDLYIHYLIAMIAQGNGEITRYNQQIALYNACYSQWWNRFNATHLPFCGTRFRF
ncbi:MAG: hypothetical protein IJP64_06290 [Oscillospiraceae bacterium]|nr:hypothetical protein [Oscillospiraceae bacterium]